MSSSTVNNNLPMETEANMPNITNSNYHVDISKTGLDLERITSSYNGLMRVYRLIYVAQHCTALQQDALLASLRYIQETHFVTLYKQV